MRLRVCQQCGLDRVVSLRQDCERYPPVSGFNVFSFIDCVIFRTCRAGGGPMTVGSFAKRWPKLIQQAIYNGWKKIHGNKAQAMNLTNGCAYHVTRPGSCRRNDLHYLAESDMNNRLKGLTNFLSVGDSAYPEMDRITNISGLSAEARQAMNGCRESIEHMFRDMGEFWKITASYKLLKMLNGGEAVLNLFDMCFVFNNLWNCKYHNQTSQWFENPPPTLQVYLGAGRRAAVAHVA